MRFLTTQAPRQPEADLRKTYDAVVVGSGAAGGMAAYVLTSQGLNVLLLEAGKQIDTTAVLKSMEWPYDHPRRGDMPAEISRALGERIQRPQSAVRHEGLATREGLLIRSGLDRLRLQSPRSSSTKRTIPYTGTNYAWVRARCLGGKTNIWGRLALRLSDYDFKGKTHDGYGEDWPISYADIAPYYDKVDLLLGISGVKENLQQLPDGKFQRPYKLNAGGSARCATRCRRWDATATPYRAGVTTDGVMHNKYRSKCLRPRRVQPPCRRLRHPCGLRFADRPDLSRARHRPADDSHERDRA